MTLPSVRPAQPDDVPELLEMVRALAAHQRTPQTVRATEASLHDHLFRECPSVFATVVEAPADAPNRLDGFALWTLSFSTWESAHGIRLEDMYVRPGRRGHGLGTRLMGRLAAECRERGGRRLEWSAPTWDAATTAFYQKLGAIPMEDWVTCRLSGLPLMALSVS